ncbi:hypothetical protein ACQ5SP_16415 [Rhodovulum sp. YNF3179]|uniref:hypothetical protein n=1 Tax=Rhodovulum sp. YNF3179 TaxID=3425127 RepID=UPI003D332FE4
MFDTTQIAHPIADPRTATRDHTLAQAQDYLADHGDGLIATARWLGGPKAGQATLALISEIAEAESWRPRFTERLTRLHRLLTLEYADDPAHPSAHAVATVCPDDPRVDAACRHAENLSRINARAPKRLQRS